MTKTSTKTTTTQNQPSKPAARKLTLEQLSGVTGGGGGEYRQIGHAGW